MKLTHKQLIERSHIWMMRNKDWVWLAPVCMYGNVELNADLPTAGTNGRDVIYGTKFLDLCTPKQILATVIHENMHKAYMHLQIHEPLVRKYEATYGLEQARMIVNMAQDFVINRSIKKASADGSVEMWDGIMLDGKPMQYCYDPKYDDEMVWDTHKIAEDLVQNAKKSGGKGGKGQPGGNGGHDQHDWEGAKKMTKQEVEEAAKQIEQALRQGQVLSRKMAGNMPRDVGELLNPAVDWRQALRDFVTERAKGGDYATYARPNRRYVGHGMYMPSTYTEVVKSILFACDTSGSIGPDDLREVLSEIRGCLEVVRPEVVDIIYWDTAVARHERYAGADVDTVLGSTKPAGGGGTAPSCVVPFCRERNIKPTVAIWLSDGYVGGDWAEELGCPAFWVISSGGQVPSHLPHAQLPARN